MWPNVPSATLVPKELRHPYPAPGPGADPGGGAPTALGFVESVFPDKIYMISHTPRATLPTESTRGEDREERGRQAPSVLALSLDLV